MPLPRRRYATALALAATLGTAIPNLSSPTYAEAPEGPPHGCTGTPSDTWITVVADGLRNGNGLLAITLYADNSKKFLVKHGSMYVGRVKAEAGTTRGCIFVPHPGVYAFALYHDENANQIIDRSGLGLPEEGWGFSNNPSTLLGIPAFTTVRLNIPRPGLVTRIHMKYP